MDKLTQEVIDFFRTSAQLYREYGDEAAAVHAEKRAEQVANGVYDFPLKSTQTEAERRKALCSQCQNGYCDMH